LAYEARGDYARAEALRLELLEARQRLVGDNHLQTVIALMALGRNLLWQKEYARVEPLLRRVLSIREKQAPNAWGVFNARSFLGEALTGLKRSPEAEALLVSGYEGLLARQETIPALYRRRNLDQALERVVQLYDAWGRKDKADEWRKKPSSPSP